MQFTSVVAFVSMAAMAVAVPTTPAPGPAPANQCAQGQVVSCCNSFVKQVVPGVSLIPVNLGIGCVVVDVLAALNPVCGANQKLACCNSGPQTGLLNVGNVCPQIL